MIASSRICWLTEIWNWLNVSNSAIGGIKESFADLDWIGLDWIGLGWCSMV